MNTLRFNRGDRVGFNLSIENYTFKEGDYINFRVYRRKGLNDLPLLDKKIEVYEETDKINITLSSAETTFGEMKNKTIEYWYEIELNDDKTVIGYKNGVPSVILLDPEGVE